uniref:Thioredoxin domain-containing protein n=1 Tax=Pseudictyota dubia TaxID=2749911 RepID=A0A7R9Z997_9STRA
MISSNHNRRAPATIGGRGIILAIFTLSYAPLRIAGFFPESLCQLRSCSQIPLHLYIEPSESNPAYRNEVETTETNRRSLAEGSIPCPASDPLCAGTTPTPIVSKAASLDRRRGSSRAVDKQKKAHLHPVTSPAQYDSEVLGTAGKNTIVVVRFHAPYCKACKMIKFAYDRFAQKTVSSTNPANIYTVKFVDVEILDQNDFPDLDVPATPYGMIYHPTLDGLGLQVVERAPIARRQFSKFKKILNCYRKGMCEMPDEFFTNPHNMFEDENLIL